MTTTHDELKAINQRLIQLTGTLADLRGEVATKRELAALEMTTKQELADMRQELRELREDERKEHRNLYATLRSELHEELASHYGAMQEVLTSRLQVILEAQQHYVRRDELQELLP